MNEGVCAVEGCELPAVRKVRVQTGGRILARTDDGQGKIVQTTEVNIPSMDTVKIMPC